jgi:hypothetical protein
MKITKQKLRRIIQEECGSAMHAEVPMESGPAELQPMMESENPEAELVTEMDSALTHLHMVMESLNAAAMMCHNCVQEVAAQGPVLQAVASQASALQETLEAVEMIVTENVAPAAPEAAAEIQPLSQGIAAAVQLEVRRRLRRK